MNTEKRQSMAVSGDFTDASNKGKDLGRFETEPPYAYLWDRCVYELLYDPQRYTEQLCDLFAQYGVDKNSAVLDTCAGSGFPAMDMYNMGYENVTCVDASDDQIELFRQKAEAQSLDIRSTKSFWNELPEHFSPGQFKALICKGSIWYAAGGWNKDFKPNREETLDALRKTLAVFYSMLDDGGVLYVDKFKDSEVDHKDIVGTFEVAGDKKDLIFYTHREREEGVRRAKMIIKDENTGEETGTPNVTYDLKEEELEQILQEVGFSVIRPNLSEEKIFTQWLAIKGKAKE